MLVDGVLVDVSGYITLDLENDISFDDSHLPLYLIINVDLGNVGVYFLNVSRGSSVYLDCLELCSYLSRKRDCDSIMDIISFVLNGIYYTPTRQNITTLDTNLRRTDLINHIQTQTRYKYQHYLEIGCGLLEFNFAMVKDLFSVAMCVDPNAGGTHRMMSDEFFAQNTQRFDVIFIDGLHDAKQVWRDVHNALRFLSPDGLILLHDCNPRNVEFQITPQLHKIWLGDVWKAIVALRAQDYIEIVVGDFDLGVGIMRRRLNTHRLPMALETRVLDDALEAFTYDEFDHHRNTLFRLKSFDELKLWLDEIP